MAENDIVAREKSPSGYRLTYRVGKDKEAPIPAEPWHLEVQYGSGTTWESAMQGHYKTEKDTLLNFAKRHSGFTETLKDVETDNPYIKQGIEAVFKEQADREAKKQAEDRQRQAEYEASNKRAGEINEQFSKVHFKTEKTKIASDKGELPDAEGLSLGGLTITDNGSSGKWKKYNITHQQSGLLVADEFPTLKDAKIAAWRLTQIMDWARPKDAVLKDLPKGTGAFARLMKSDPYAEYPEDLKTALEKARVKAIRRPNPQGGETPEELGDVQVNEGYGKPEKSKSGLQKEAELAIQLMKTQTDDDIADLFKKSGPHLTNNVGLHSDYENWAYFLKTQTELKETKNGWKHYVSSNAHYIVSPEGAVATFYGFHGNAAFERLSGSRVVEPTEPSDLITVDMGDPTVDVWQPAKKPRKPGKLILLVKKKEQPGTTLGGMKNG